MTSIKNTISSYNESIHLIHGRILELHDEIEKKGGEGHPKTHGLARRRHLLYREMWEMQESMRSLEEYVQQVQAREVL